nr:antibiotic biosynthesis monooxygenase [Propionibacterium sp.]
MSHDPAAEPGRVTRIARRRAIPGHEEQYEEGVRAMLAAMKTHRGFLAGELLPPEQPGGWYQVVVNFDTEEHLAEWDASRDREDALVRLRPHALDEPDYRRLTGLEAWFEGPVVPASMRPPKHRMAFVTWLGIWPTASFFIFFVSPLLNRLGLPFLLVTAINTLLITAVMTYLLMPNLTRLMRGFLNPKPRD